MPSSSAPSPHRGPTCPRTFADADPEQAGGAYDAAQRLARRFRDLPITGVGWTKVYKVLHIKRPALYPIPISACACCTRSSRWSGRRGSPWCAMPRAACTGLRCGPDVVNPANQAALAQARAEMPVTNDTFKRLRPLPDVRLLDILAWSVGRSKPPPTL